ncbi:MAG TPA: hypothetical protein VFG43_12895 [Geminicoccaceae bacterium]|nr:hypothetical protein [Geminicoccaceae bacterium]
MTAEAAARRILVVEDEMLIALDLDLVLRRAGYEVVGPAGRVGEALRLLAREPGLDGALLDVQVDEETVFPVADALVARGVPFLFLSGYGTDILPPAHRARPCLIKPYSTRTLIAALARIVPD